MVDFGAGPVHTNVHGFSLCRYLPFDEWMLGVGPDAASSLATPVGTAAFLSMATAVAAPEGPLPLGEQPCELLVTSVSPGSPYDPTNAKRAGEPYTVTFSLLVRPSTHPNLCAFAFDADASFTFALRLVG